MNAIQFNQLMSHTFTVKKRVRDWQGNFIDSTTTTGVEGFAQYGKKLVTNRKGETVTASAIIFFKKDAPIDSEYEYWLISQTAPYKREDMEVIRIDPIEDPRYGTIHHYEISVK